MLVLGRVAPFVVSAVLLSTPVAAQAIRVVGATEKVYQADTSLPSTSTSATLYAAQNEFEGFQIVVTGPASNVSVTANALTGPGGFQIIPSAVGKQGDIMVYREVFITLPPPGGRATDSAAKQGSAPDGLIPQVDEFYQEARNATVPSVSAGQNAVFFVDVQVPPAATPGLYTGSVTVNASGAATDVPVTLTVWPFALPSTPTLKTYIPFEWNAASTQYPALAGQCCNDTVAQAHLRHAILGVNHRVTIHSFDYGNFDLNAYKLNFGALIDGNAATLLKGAHPTALAYLGPHGTSNTLATWRNFFAQNGWSGYLIDYAADEPANGLNSTWCSLMAAAAEDTAAGVRSVTTTSIGLAQNASCTDARSPFYGQKVNLANINVFTPVVDQVQTLSMTTGQSTMGDYAAWRAGSLGGLGNEVWQYQSCDSWDCGSGTPTGWPSYAIDHSAIRARALEWISFRNGITGELYWKSVIAWTDITQTPWTNQYWSGGNGDGTLIYPGPASSAQVGGTHDIPLSSLRLKMLREGVEDYEYLALLGRLGDGAYADAQVDSVFPTAHSVTGVSPQTLESARYNLACRIVTDQHPGWTCDPATWGTGSASSCTRSDCFSRPDSATLGSNWNTYSGAFQIVSGQAANSAAGATDASVWLTPVGPDQDVAADCKVTGPGSNCGVMARWSGANDCYYAYLDAGMGAVHLWRLQAGAVTQLGAASRTIAAGAFHHLRLVAQGSSISVYFDAETTPAIAATDTALTAGSYGGLHAYGGAAQAVWYSSFDIRALAPPAPVADFSIALSPQSVTVQQGASATYTVSTAVTSGAAQTVALSATGLPAGASAAFNPAAVVAGGSSTLTIATSSTTPAGTSALTITGAGATTRTASASLTVQVPIAFRAMSTTAVAAGVTRNVRLAVPAAARAGDALIATLFLGEYNTRRGTPSVTAPSGWTLVRRATHGSAGVLLVYSRTATAADPGTTWLWSASIRVGASASLLAYSGASAIETSAAQDNAFAGTTYATPALTTAASGDRLVAIYAGAAQGTSTGTWSVPAGMTQRVSTSNGGALSLSQDDAAQAAAGPSGTFSSTATGSQAWALSALIALRR